MQTPGRAGQPPMGCGHEGRSLLVPRQDELDRRVAQRLDDVEIFLARNAEDAVDALVLQRRDQEIGTFSHDEELSRYCFDEEQDILARGPGHCNQAWAASRSMMADAKSLVEAVPPRSSCAHAVLKRP